MTPRALVVGAGPAGLGAALELATWCASVTVVEARPRHRRRGAGEHLPSSALPTLASLGLASLLRDARHDASPGVRSAWGEEAVVDKEYYATVPGRGLNLRRELFDESLAQRAEQAGATLRFDTCLRHLIREADGYTATLRGADGLRTLGAEIVVDASGRRAVAARKLGAVRHRFDELVALLGRLEGCAPTDEPGRVHVESVEDGWWYGVVLSGGTLLATFMTDAGLVRQHPGGAPDLWKKRLAASRLLGPLASTGRWSGRLEAFDAATQALELEELPGLLAVGDAATAYDPLSSWGITKGILDGHAGARALAREQGGEPGALAEHRARRMRDFEQHRTRQHDFYRAETRWTGSPFWRSRQRAS